ncbi:MAG TPA: MFS transporter [Actinophytocola sp.]|uniref:MFS transporter n=1 Tax=Actinophytocola sp. TaxID=1872138 RepID=UPI002DBBBB9C|nr:MFS transporter [Actinophytocola sp.]HEU5469128.1 MFS transporter [Actinophytocola sp.]
MNRRAGLVALLAAEVISALGNWISVIVLPWLVLVRTGSPVLMGLVAVGVLVPYLASGVLAAPLADRFGLRRTSIATDLGSALATAAIAAVPEIGYLPLLVLAGMSGALRGVGDRAKHVLLAPMARQAGMPVIRMTSLYETLTRGTQMVGAPVGGLLIYWLGTNPAIWVDAATFVVCAALVAVWVRPVEPATGPTHAPAAREPYLTALRGGVSALWRDRVLFAMIVAIFVVNVVTQAGTTVFVPLWVAEVLRSPAALGIVLSAFAAGAVLGGVVFTVLAPKMPPYLMFGVAVMVSGGPRLLVLGGDNVALVLAVTFGSGVAVAAVNPILGALLYERVPPRLQTRVFGLVAAGTYGGLPAGAALAGIAVAAFGFHTATLLGGVLAIAVSALTLRMLQQAVRTDRNRPYDDIPAVVRQRDRS